MSSTLDIYTQHFGLSERPFSLVPDPSFVFWSDAHRRAFTILEYGLLTRAPITLVTGEVGVGKTTLLHALLASVTPEVRVALVPNAQGDRSELLRWVLQALGRPTAADEGYVELFARFQHALDEEYAAGRRVALVFDEAQNLGRDALEEIRMFTNVNSGKDELLQVILVGQPELREVVTRPDMLQLAQRIVGSFHLSAMDADTVHGYVNHRLAVAGAQGDLFSRPATDLVHFATGGVPRLVNQLCDLAMVYAFTKGEMQVGRRTVDEVLTDGVFFAARPVELPSFAARARSS